MPVDISAKLELNVTGVKSGSLQAASSLQEVQNKVVETQQAFKSFSTGNPLAPLNTSVKTLQSSLNSLKISGISDPTKPLVSGLQKASGASRSLQIGISQISGEIPNFFQSARIGFMSIGNNIQPLSQAFAGLRAEGKSTGAIMKEFGKALLSPQTLLLVGVGIISAYGSQLIEMAMGADKAADSVKIMSDAIASDKEYADAIRNVSELKSEFDLANQGLISQEDALKHYNETMGKTTGQVESFTDAQKIITDSSDEYIKAMALRAAANAAFDLSAKKTVEAMARLARPKVTAGDFFSGLLGGTAAGAGAAAYSSLNTATDLMNEAGDLTKIAQDFQKQFAELAKKNNFDFFSDGDDKTKTKTKREKAKKEQVDALKELAIAYADIDTQLSTHLIHIGDVAKLQSDAVVKAMATLRKQGIKADDPIMKGLTDLQDHFARTLGDQSVIEIKQPKIKLLKPELSKDTHLLPIKELGAKADEELTQLIDNISQSGITDLANSIGQAIGSGEGFTGIFDGFKSSLGSAIQDFGKWVITQAIVIKTLKDTIKTWIIANPALAIGAGVALVALGAAMKASMSNPGTNFTGSTSSGGSFSGNIGGGVSSPGYSGGRLASAPAGNINTALQNAMANQDPYVFVTQIDGTTINLIGKRAKQLNGI